MDKEIKLVVLSSGVPLIAEVQYFNKIVCTTVASTNSPFWTQHGVIRVHYPHMLKLVPAPDKKGVRLALADWLMFTKEDWVDIKTEHILYLEEPDEYIAKAFKEKRSGLALPPTGLVTP